MDEALLEQQRKAYAVDGVDENQPAVQPKKRKNEDNNGDIVSTDLFQLGTERRLTV